MQNYVEAFGALIDSLADKPIPAELEPPLEEPSTLRSNKWAATRCSPPAQNRVTQYETIPTARDATYAAMQEYAEISNPAHMLLVKGKPGIGKTTAGVNLAHWMNQVLGRRVMYSGSRHDFLADIRLISAENDYDPDDWYEWLARQWKQADPARDTCRYADEQKRFIGRGYNARLFCEGICGKPYMRDQCPYLAQVKTDKPIIYVQHQHVTSGHPLASDCQILIGDENPMGVFPNFTTIPVAEMHWSNLPETESLIHILHHMAQIAASGRSVSGFDMYVELGIENVIYACDEFGDERLGELSSPRITSLEQAANVNYNVLPTLLGILRREAQAALEQRNANEMKRDANDKTISAFPERISMHNGQMEIISRNYISKEMPKHIIWFDGTGQEQLFEAMFDRPVKVIEPNVELKANVVQVHDRRNGIGSMRHKVEADPEGRILTDIELTDKVAQARMLIDHILATKEHKKPVIITHKAISAALGADAHFYANRGTNAFQDCNAMFIVGTPQPPLQQLEKLARALWFNEMKAFDNTWITVNRPYNYIDPNDGQGWSQPVSEYADPRLNLLLWQQREAEIIQSAHRARPLTNDNVTIYLLTNIPIDELPPTQLVSQRELMGTPEGVNVFMWQSVLALADKVEAEKGCVTIQDIEEGLPAGRNTAAKYLKHLTETGAWIESISRAPNKGRPSKNIVRS